MKCSRCRCQEAAPGYKACQRCRDYAKSRAEQNNAAQRAYYERNTESRKEAAKALKQRAIDEKRYHCEACGFTTGDKTHLTKHEGTRKHARNTECNDRASSRARRYEERKQSGTVDVEHGKISKRDPARIDQEAQRIYGFKMLDSENYTNATSRVEWECLTCRHSFRAPWKTLCILQKCFGPNHGNEEAPKPQPQGLTDADIEEMLGSAL